jgi:hypothetical protein
MKTLIHMKTLLVSTILATAMVGSIHANVIINGDFANNVYGGTLGNQDYSPTLGTSSIANWSWSPTANPYPTAVRLQQTGGIGSSTATSAGEIPDGVDFCVSLEGATSWIKQSVTLGAGQYNLSFDAAWVQWAYVSANPIYASLNGVNFSFNSSTSAFTPTNSWLNYSSDLFTVATAGTYELKIAANNPGVGPIYSGLTGCSAVANVNLTAVPEPSTYALVVGGIATLLLIRRRIQA